MVVSLHLEVEDLGVAGGSEGDEAGVEELEDSIADVGELSLDLGAAVMDDGDVVLVAATLALSRGSNGRALASIRHSCLWNCRSYWAGAGEGEYEGQGAVEGSDGACWF